MKDYLEIYCVTNKKLNFLEKSKYFLAAVGKENFSSDYIKSDNGQNIFHKEIYGKEGDWTGIKKFRGDSKFSTYLYKIITYRALDFIKSKGMKYRPKTDSVDNVRINVASAEINIDNKMTLNNALSILKDKEQKIVRLASEGYKHREIADKFNTSTNNISSILSRAYGKMKKYMQEK